MQVQCNKCKYIGDESEFPKGRDFCQQPYVAACPKCDNSQSHGDASMRMFGGDRPFTFIRPGAPSDPVSKVFHAASDAS